MSDENGDRSLEARGFSPRAKYEFYQQKPPATGTDVRRRPSGEDGNPLRPR